MRILNGDFVRGILHGEFKRDFEWVFSWGIKMGFYGDFVWGFLMVF